MGGVTVDKVAVTVPEWIHVSRRIFDACLRR